MVQRTSTGGARAGNPYCPEEIGEDLSVLWDSVGQPTASDDDNQDASDLSAMAVRNIGPGKAQQEGEETMDTVVRRLVAEKHWGHFDHFALETRVVQAGIALGIKATTYPNLHIHRHHVWVICQCGATLLLE